MKKKILLVGVGAEIGSLLLSIKNKNKSFDIDTAITRPIFKDKKKNFDSIIARIILSNPSEIDKIGHNLKKNEIFINNKKIKIFFKDIEKDNIKLNKFFFASILATSKKHINDQSILKKLKSISKFVFGVAENVNLPAFYPSLNNTKSKVINDKFKKIKDQKIFALGSCQTNGWLSQLNALTYSLDRLIRKYEFLNFEVDIIHPDTPTGKLGTKSFEPRAQESRNNFRPSFSQVQLSINRIFPKVRSINTVSLRTLIDPPGYMISRFFFETKNQNLNRLKLDSLKSNLHKFSNQFPNILKVTDLPLGSKAFSFSKEGSVLLSSEKYLHLKQNLFSSVDRNIHEIIFQSYVHNTRGYCHSVLNSLDFFIKNKNKKIII